MNDIKVELVGGPMCGKHYTIPPSKRGLQLDIMFPPVSRGAYIQPGGDEIDPFSPPKPRRGVYAPRPGDITTYDWQGEV